MTNIELLQSTKAEFGSLKVTGTATFGKVKVLGQIETMDIVVNGVATFNGDIKLGAKVNTRQAITKKFKASKVIAAGSVVVLDTTKEGYVTTTTTLMDTRVVGVAVQAATKVDQEIEVALSGSVQVRVDKAAVTVGDIIVSDILDGLARAETTPKPGSILGKATSAKDKDGLVWLLIVLQ